MAFPAIAAVAGSTSEVSGSPAAANLPSGIANGDLLIMVFHSAAAGAIGWPAGWTELDDTADAVDQTALAYRHADGTEGATINVTHASAKWASVCFRITGHLAATAPAFVANTAATGAQPNPSSLTPAGGAKDYLWLVAVGCAGEQTITTYPTNYSLSQTEGTSGVAGATTINARVRMAGRQLNAASEDPGAFALSSTVDGRVYTIAVSPAAASTTTFTPAAIAAVAEEVVAVLGLSLVLVPASVAVVAEEVAPALGRVLVFSPTPAVVVAEEVAPALGLSLVIAPASVAAPLLVVAPAVGVGGGTTTFTPAAIAAALEEVAPGLSLVVALAPSPAVVAVEKVAPSLVTALSLAPAAIAAALALPSSVLGKVVTLAPAPVAAQAVSAVPLLALSLVLAPAAVPVVLAGVAPSVSYAFTQTIAPDAVRLTLVVQESEVYQVVGDVLNLLGPRARYSWYRGLRRRS